MTTSHEVSVTREPISGKTTLFDICNYRCPF